MDPQTFNSLKSQLKEMGSDLQPFFSNKKGLEKLSLLQNYWFSGEQAAEVIGNFPYASGSLKNKVLALIEPRFIVLTGVDAKKVVAGFIFADEKLKAVGLVANHINDPVGKYAVLEAMDFNRDKVKARKILDEARPPAPHTQCPAQPCSQPPPPQDQPPAQPAPYQQPPQSAPNSQPPPEQAQPYQPPPQSTPHSQAP